MCYALPFTLRAMTKEVPKCGVCGKVPERGLVLARLGTGQLVCNRPAGVALHNSPPWTTPCERELLEGED